MRPVGRSTGSMTGTFSAANEGTGESEALVNGLVAVSAVVAGARSLRRARRDLNSILRPQFGVSVRRVVTSDVRLRKAASLDEPGPREAAALDHWRRLPRCAEARSIVHGDSILVPVLRRGLVAGALDVAVNDASKRLDDQILGVVATACVAILDNVALRSRALDAERRLAAVSERERIARDAHDVVGQRIVTIGRRVAGHLVDTRDVAWRRRLEELLDLSREANCEVRGAVHALVFLDARRDDLVASLEALADRFERTTDATCDVAVVGNRLLLNDARADVLFRVVHEALVNILRHSRASAVGIHLEFSVSGVALTVRDDGMGIAHRDPFGLAGRFGLRTMRERVQHAGGRLQIAPAHPRGVVVEATLPLRPRRAHFVGGAR